MQAIFEALSSYGTPVVIVGILIYLGVYFITDTIDRRKDKQKAEIEADKEKQRVQAEAERDK